MAKKKKPKKTPAVTTPPTTQELYDAWVDAEEVYLGALNDFVEALGNSEVSPSELHDLAVLLNTARQELSTAHRAYLARVGGLD